MLVNVTNIQLTVNEIPVDTVSNMMFFKLRVDYVGGPDGIHNGDTISIKIDNIANDILKITGFGNTTSNIYGDEPIGKVGTRTYRNDQDGNYYLDIVFDDGYMNVLGPIAGITGWYEASAYIEYKREVLEPGDQTEIEIFANAIRIPISVNVKPGGGVGPIPIDTPGSIVGKSGRYGDHSGNVYDIPEVENNNYAEFDPMRWNIYIGYQNLTWRDLRGSGGTSYFTTANSLNFSNNNPIDNRYQSVNEPYLVPYKPAPWFEIDAPFHYKNVEIDDYLVIGSHNGAFASGQNFVRESLRIIKVLGREENNTWWGKDAFRVLADSNFLIESENEPIDRFLTDLFFKGYRGLKIDEFLSKLQSEGQFLGKTVDDILKFDYVKNSEAPFVVDYKDYQIGHFNLKLGDFYFSSTINEILNLVGTSNEILFKNIPAKNLPYAYWIYFDTNAIEAVLDNGAFFYENVASLKYSEGQHNTESNPLWIKVEDASGGGGKPTELRIKKVDENDNQLQGIKFILTQTNLDPKKKREAVSTINGTASFTLGIGTYNLVEELPLGSMLKPFSPMNFKISDIKKPVNLIELLKEEDYPNIDDIKFNENINIIVNHSKSTSIIIRGIKTVAGINPPEVKFDFKLTQVANSQGDPFDGDPIVRTTSIVGSGEFEFSEIIGLTEGTYYFKIQETNGGGKGWENDTSVKIIKINVGTYLQ